MRQVEPQARPRERLAELWLTVGAVDESELTRIDGQEGAEDHAQRGAAHHEPGRIDREAELGGPTALVRIQHALQALDRLRVVVERRQPELHLGAGDGLAAHPLAGHRFDRLDLVVGQ